jgi:hydrogenase nickel incorporation protein HypB
MCQDCGCAATSGHVHITDHKGELPAKSVHEMPIDVLTGILHENDHAAAHNREHFESHGVLAVNLMSSPGSGKTSLLEATIEALGDRLRLAVIEGDLETENDARRIRAKGVPAIQVTTGQTCHLDAHMIHDALHGLDLSAIDILFIENVGNLVCPAGFDLGQHANITLLSVTEGDDKPVKYPVSFRSADLVLLSKVDLLDVFDDFSPEEAERHVRALANPAEIVRVSVRRPDTLAPWLAWLEEKRAEHRKQVPLQPHSHHGGAHVHAVE